MWDWLHVESPSPFLFVHMNMKHCITDYEMNLENHFNQVQVSSSVEHIGLCFNNEVSRAVMWKLFELNQSTVHYGVL